ncbi:MAG: aerobic carbon-monoxide dehydrogenase large subunit [Solirubrobacteraceae bacterium]|nr:aerobic carbon-monoxide dehydrogenase large subunit [Solirubrobacteraceae bacterium]
MATEVQDAPAGRAQTYVGSRVLRTEDPRFLTGAATFTDDIRLPGMLHAAFLRSPHAHARVTSIDTTRAAAIPGVVGVFTEADISQVLGPFVTEIARPEVQTITRPALNSATAYFVGQPLVVVVAESRYVAEDALDELDVEYEVLPALMDPLEALDPDSPVFLPGLDSNNHAHIEFQRGDVDRLFAEADHVFSRRLVHGRHMAAPLEARGVVADYRAATGELTVWSSTQLPHYLRTFLAGPLGIAENKIRVIAESVGGGFGMKCIIFDEDGIIPAVSRLLGRPVKWTEDRYENLAASVHAKDQICEMEAAVTSDGRILAFRGHHIGVGGAWPGHPWTGLVDPLCAALLMPGIYDIEAVGFIVDCPLTNRAPIGPYRGIGWTAGHAATQLLLDDVADALGMDRTALRLKNAIPDAPFVSATGMSYDGGSYSASIHKLLEMVDMPAFRERQARLREDGRYIGIGISPYIEPTGWGAEMSRAQGLPFEFFDSASVTVEPDGSVTVTTGMQSHGQSHETTFAQVAADALGVRFEDIRVLQGDSSIAAYGNGTYASRSAVIGGATIMRAGRDVRDKLIRMAAHAMEVSVDDVEMADGHAGVRGVPSKRMSLREIADLAYYGGARRPKDVEPSLTATRSYDPPQTYANGTFAAVVEVDPGTGTVKIEEIVCCEDCGRMLNPMVVDGQVHGAVAQGIGGLLYEEIAYDDETGQLITGTLVDYLYPSAVEVPGMRIAHIETPSVVTEGGIKGAGECGTIAAGPAILSAITDALTPFGRIEITKTPLRPGDILDLMDAARR